MNEFIKLHGHCNGLIVEIWINALHIISVQKNIGGDKDFPTVITLGHRDHLVTESIMEVIDALIKIKKRQGAGDE